MRAWESCLKVEGWTSQYKSVQNYLSHYKRKLGSEGTKDLVCDTLMSFCKFAESDPDNLVERSSEEASKLVQEFVDSIADKGRSIRTVNVALAFLKIFFKVNGFRAGRELEVERYHQPSRYRKRPEYVPTSDEIYRMAYSAGSAKNKAMILALYTSGVRNSTLRALLYKDVKEELKSLEVVRIPVYPEMKIVDSGACKGNIPYYSFISREAVASLKDYLDERQRLHGEIKDNEPLFASTSTNVPTSIRRQTPTKRRSLCEVVKRTARKSGIRQWQNVYPHCLRKAFESALRNAGLDLKDQEFLMGHILPGTQDPYYDHTKVEDLRTKYANVRFFKATEVDKLEMIKAFAQTLGIDKIEIKIQKLREQESGLDEMEALGKIMREELGIKSLETKPTKHSKGNNSNNCTTNDNCDRHEGKIVTEKKLLPHLNEGWEIIKEFRNGKVVVRRKL